MDKTKAVQKTTYVWHSGPKVKNLQAVSKEDDKNLTCFIQDLWQTLKATGSGQKMSKTKVVQKTTYMWHSGPKG